MSPPCHLPEFPLRIQRQRFSTARVLSPGSSETSSPRLGPAYGVQLQCLAIIFFGGLEPAGMRLGCPQKNFRHMNARTCPRFKVASRCWSVSAGAAQKPMSSAWHLLGSLADRPAVLARFVSMAKISCGELASPSASSLFSSASSSFR